MKRILGILLVMALLIATVSASAGGAIGGPGKYETNFEIFTFGRYEQDNNPENGPEPIRWIVLEKQDGKMLLWSKDILDKKKFNEVYEKTTWEQCTLRAWLNNDFFQTAFTEEEQAAILVTDVDNSLAQHDPNHQYQYDTSCWHDTQDRIYLISYGEAVKYFPVQYDRRSAPTDYAIAQGVLCDPYYEVDGRKTGMWWLRSASQHQWRAALSYFPGSLRDTYATKNIVGVRPMMWVDTGKVPTE